MKSFVSRIFFDKQDHRLLNIVNEVLERRESFRHLNDLLYPYLHPHGIKELAESRGLRIAYAVIRLLESLDAEKRNERLHALQSLRDEVLNSADSHMRKNTARVLLQIMKELVRTRDDNVRQLELAHDFRSAVSGKPRIIRRLLREHHLLEMPEEWNQIAFDGHVHDAYTKGRKFPAHLIMDAWIKGIRNLTVIYYNYADPAPALELLEASEIMGIDVRIGIELPAAFHDRHAQLIWIPRGFSDAQDFITFLAEPHVKVFMDEGRKISEYRHGFIVAVLEVFNKRCRSALNKTYGLNLRPLDPSEFLSSVGAGQASILHLAKFIHAHLVEELKRRVEELNRYGKSSAEGGAESQAGIAELIGEMDRLDSEAIADSFLKPISNDLMSENNMPHSGSEVPQLLGLSATALIDRLSKLHSGCRIVLNLTGLKVEDVLELLYDCHGAITHLEIFNLKDHIDEEDHHYKEINELQQVINDGDTFALTRFIRRIIGRMDGMQGQAAAERRRKFQEILQNAPVLKACYRNAPLKSSIGSDSSGHSHRHHGMGFVIKETLPGRVQRRLSRPQRLRRLVAPLRLPPVLHTIFTPVSNFRTGTLRHPFHFTADIPVFGKRREEWEIGGCTAQIVSEGNLVSLGGIHERKGNGFCPGPRKPATHRDQAFLWRYMNGILKNALKISIGFAASAATFMYTQDWWFLIYLGTPIWFAITGLRNVLQSIFGGGGIGRSPLLKWNSYVSWDRLSDSLLYTGLSVPLLEYLLKTLILDEAFHITTSSGPILLYSIMSLVNGVYISGHNLLRGLPRGAVIGNLFRSVLNIPLSIGFNSAIGSILGAFGVAAIEAILQQWASIISKTSSDVAAAIIEGVADRQNYAEIRRKDYVEKFSQVMSANERLEMMFPEPDSAEILESSNKFNAEIRSKISDIRKIMIVNALDLLYFWMYQPRARTVCRSLFANMSKEELSILAGSQSILQCRRDIAILLANGLVGGNFSRPLSFYLDYAADYLKAIEEAAHIECHDESRRGSAEHTHTPRRPDSAAA